MTPNQVKRKRGNLDRKMDDLHLRKKLLQETCQHPNVDRKYCGSSGNYDPTQDAYWIEWKCPDCHKFWTTEQ